MSIPATKRDHESSANPLEGLGWAVDRRPGPGAGRVRIGPGARPPEARRNHGNCLWVLRHRVWPHGPLGQWRGGQPQPGSALSREPRHGVPEGVGGLGRLGCPRPGHDAPASESRHRCDGTGGLVPGSSGLRVADEIGATELGAAIHRLPEHRPDLHRGDGAAGRPLQVRHARFALRLQHAPVHGDGACRLQAESGLRCPTLHLRRFRGVGLPRVRGLQSRGRAPDPVATGASEPAPSGDPRA